MTLHSGLGCVCLVLRVYKKPQPTVMWADLPGELQAAQGSVLCSVKPSDHHQQHHSMGNTQSAKAPAAEGMPPQTQAPAPMDASACPVINQPGAGYRNPAVYNVYGQRINDPNAPVVTNPLTGLKNSDVLDPRNNMPLEPNQMPCPGQRKPLSTERVASTIPKGGTDSTWLFPSPQMVFNALKRKGKGDDVTEDDMDGFIAAHNAMNETTWQQVNLWEKLHADQCCQATLLRFTGKPHDLSPLAWMRSVLGGTLPFDRHDWVVDRCGKEVRYIIDFYFHDDKAGTPQAFEIITRPALDSVEAALDRVKMSIYLRFAEWGLPCPVTGTTGQLGAAMAESAKGAGQGSAAAVQQ